MISFASDYIAGAHPEVLKRLCETNLEALPGYGTDRYCESAKEKIRLACSMPEAQVEFIAGGTQTNAVVISSVLKDHEGVIAARTGHISVHEAGAVEYTGHKVLELDPADGKLNADRVRSFVAAFHSDAHRDHMVYPGMVYISHPTEYGTLYTKKELEELSAVCREYGMTLFLDGARLGYALMSRGTDVTLHDIAELTDVFYIGGTKVGALCGEAVVFTKNNMPPHFITSIKRRGAMLAKGRLLGIQFDALFTDGLYYEIGSHGIEMAEKLKTVFRDLGYTFFIDSPTNQQFLIMENGLMEKLSRSVIFEVWEKVDTGNTAVRFVTSWSTTDEDIEGLKNILKKI